MSGTNMPIVIDVVSVMAAYDVITLTTTETYWNSFYNFNYSYFDNLRIL